MSEVLTVKEYGIAYKIEKEAIPAGKFLEGFPDEYKAINLPENPFLQFKKFIIFTAEQLKTSDVEKSIFREYKELGLLKESTRWYYKGTLNRAYKEISKLAFDARRAIIADYEKLLISLKKHSIFWFSIRRENIARVRKSDIFIYRLSNILLSRINDIRDKGIDS